MTKIAKINEMIREQIGLSEIYGYSESSSSLGKVLEELNLTPEKYIGRDGKIFTTHPSPSIEGGFGYVDVCPNVNRVDVYLETDYSSNRISRLHVFVLGCAGITSNLCSSWIENSDLKRLPTLEPRFSMCTGTGTLSIYIPVFDVDAVNAVLFNSNK